MRWTLTLGCVLTACTTLGVRLEHAPNAPDRLRVAAARLEERAPPATRAWLELDAEGLIASRAPEDGRVLWRRSVPDARELRAEAGLVLALGSRDVTVLDLADGSPRTTLSGAGSALIGAAASATAVVLVRAEAAAGRSPQSRVACFDARSGQPRWSLPLHGPAGAPIVIDELALVPWSRQALSVIDLALGREIARFQLRDDALDWLRGDARGVSFGSAHAHRFDASRPDGLRTDEPIGRVTELPGRAARFPSAFERARIHEKPPFLRVLDGSQPAQRVLVFYRALIALDGLKVRWAQVLPADVLAAEVAGDHLHVVGRDGGTHWVRLADGAALATSPGDGTLRDAWLDGTTPPAASGFTARDSDPRRDLWTLLTTPDARLVPAQAFAVPQLAAWNDAETTRDLLGLLAEPKLAPPLREAVVALLGQREQAAPALAALLDSPRLGEREQLALIQGLAALGQADALLAFVQLYRADSSFAERPTVLATAAAAVHALAAAKADAQLASIAQAASTHPALRSAIAELLDPPPPPAVEVAAPAQGPELLPQFSPPPPARAQPPFDALRASRDAERRARAAEGAAREFAPMLWWEVTSERARKGLRHELPPPAPESAPKQAPEPEPTASPAPWWQPIEH